MVLTFSTRAPAPRGIFGIATPILFLWPPIDARVYADHEGRIWVGTDGGLSRYDATTDGFVTYGEAMSAARSATPRVRAIREDHDGALWIGTVNGGSRIGSIRHGSVLTVFRHDPKNPRSLSHDRVWAVLEDDAQRLWVATADGLDLFDRGSAPFVRYGHDADNPQSLRDGDIMSLYQDRGGVLWVGTREGGASHWNPRSWLLGHYFSEAFRGTQMNPFADDGAGKLWVGTIGGGWSKSTPAAAASAATARERERRRASFRRSRHGAAPRSSRRPVDRHHGRRPRSARSSQRRTARLPPDRADAEHPARRRRHVAVRRSARHALGRYFWRRLGQHRQGDRQDHALPVWYRDREFLSGSKASAIVEDSLGNLWIGTPAAGSICWSANPAASMPTAAMTAIRRVSATTPCTHCTSILMAICGLAPRAAASTA